MHLRSSESELFCSQSTLAEAMICPRLRLAAQRKELSRSELPSL